MKNPVIETDILIIGGGPAGLSTAIHLADLVKKHNESAENEKSVPAKLSPRILLLEKANAMGNHTLSGAVINPVGLRELLPDIQEKDIPFETPVLKEDVQFFTKNKSFALPFHPPYMGNKGNYIASLGKIVRWLSEIAEKKGIQVFSGFNGHEILYENGKVSGVRTGASGIDAHGTPMENYQPATDIRAKITIFAEGTRGSLTKTLIKKFDLDKDRNPQVYSLGVKEIWEIPEGVLPVGYIAHTLGFPLKFDQFGGGFIYALSKNLVAIGLVVGLDSKDTTFDTHHAFQVYKKHPFVSKLIEKGKLLRYGAKTIPEGGFFSMPKLYHDNALIVGDSAGFLAMPSLKGIHLAIQSGMMAAKTAFEAVKKNDTSSRQLSLYEELFKKSQSFKELYVVRNFRQAFKTNLFLGMLQFGTQILTGGRGLSFSGRLKIEEDYKHYQPVKEFKGKTFLERNKEALIFDKKLTFDKETDIFFSGTKHDEEQPSHIVVPSAKSCETCIEDFHAPCQRYCPAQVFEISADAKTGKKGLKLHSSNCVHCKTCDIVDPMCNVTWTTPYGGDGPEYENM
ncbi:MAG: electron-transfer flavoprotein:ubiquinone oxidoreductase [Candidatus Omnitrophota bacterium]